MKTLDIKNVEDIEIEGVDPSDYPDLCDAFIARAFNLEANRECTEEELEYLQETYPEVVNEMAYESLIP
ncbi:MAG: hypothetical protein KDD03_13300 [Gelidibacter sp.]|nr:hypothetical protein [Gelidibacter sp.]